MMTSDDEKPIPSLNAGGLEVLHVSSTSCCSAILYVGNSTKKTPVKTSAFLESVAIVRSPCWRVSTPSLPSPPHVEVEGPKIDSGDLLTKSSPCGCLGLMKGRPEQSATHKKTLSCTNPPCLDPTTVRKGDPMSESRQLGCPTSPRITTDPVEQDRCIDHLLNRVSHGCNCTLNRLQICQRSVEEAFAQCSPQQRIELVPLRPRHQSRVTRTSGLLDWDSN